MAFIGINLNVFGIAVILLLGSTIFLVDASPIGKIIFNFNLISGKLAMICNVLLKKNYALFKKNILKFFFIAFFQFFYMVLFRKIIKIKFIKF